MKNKTSSQVISGADIQEHISIAEIKDGMVVLKDGSLRAVLAVSSVNFDLKSTTEQEAIVIAFQRFLNTLDFSIQILVSTRRFDIKPYIKMLEEQRKVEKNPLLRNQIKDYVGFIREMVNVSNIVTKMFYITVPFYVIESEKDNLFDKVRKVISPRKAIFQNREEFKTNKDQMFRRITEVEEALAGAGLRITQLDTQELIEMYYNYYNPSEFDHITVAPIDNLGLEK